MHLEPLLKTYFSAKDRQRGVGYFRGGMVVDIVDHGSHISAQIENDDGHIYDVMVEISGGECSLDCTCMRFANGYACKHLWAAILSIDEQFYGHTRDATRRNRPDSSNGKAGKRKQQPKVPVWQQVFAQVEQKHLGQRRPQIETSVRRERKIWYVISASKNLNATTPTIEFQQQETLQNGEPGASKELRLDDRTPALIEDESHSAALTEINRWRTNLVADSGSSGQYSGYSHYRGYGDTPTITEWKLSPLVYDVVLPKLFATGCVCWRLDSMQTAASALPLAWDDGDAWKFVVDVKTDKKKKSWQFCGTLKRGTQSLPLSKAVAVYSDGLVLFQDQLARLDINGNQPWLQPLQSVGSIQVPFKDREKFVKAMGDSEVFAGVQVPDSLLPAAEVIEPQGRIRFLAENFRDGNRSVAGIVDFLYGETSVGLDEHRIVLFTDDLQSRVQRHVESEQRILRQLPDSVREYKGAIWGEDRPDIQCAGNKLVQSIGFLLETDWVVELEGSKIHNAGQISVTVESGQDWFDLDGDFTFDESKIALPAILAAVKEGKKFVPLKDGSLGMLPAEWLQKFGKLVDLGSVDDDKVRFRKSQAMVLDALLAAQDHSKSDRKFQTFVRKLTSFEGVKPKEAPRSFQGELRDYQKEGLAWLHFLREFGLGGCLADDMGLGKTVQVLALLESRRVRRLKKGESRRPSLVVVPRSLVFNWIEEAGRFTPKLKVANYTGLDRKSVLDHIDEFDVLVTTYGSMRNDIEKLQDIEFDYAILDESQAIKNSNSQAAKACRLLNSHHRLAMTGTPIENHLGELWSLFEFLNPGMLGRSTAFKKLSKQATSDRATQTIDVAKESGARGTGVLTDKEAAQNAAKKNSQVQLRALANAVRPYLLRRTKKEVLSELPDKTEQTLYCELSAKQRKAYNEVRDYYRTNLLSKVKQKGLAKSKIHVLEALLRLRQAACHPGLIDPTRIPDGSAKLEILTEHLRELTAEGHKALVFSQFTSLLAIVKDELDKHNVTYEYLDGKTVNRQQKVERFQTDEDCSTFLISLKAGGSGLNLTAAEYVFILDPWWNPAVEAQAIDRSHRMGQTNQVFAYRMIARGTVEERILELQKGKRDLAEAVISANGSLISDLTADDLQLLLS